MKSIKSFLLTSALFILLGSSQHINAQDTANTSDENVVVQDVNSTEAKKLIDENPNYVVLDVRTPIEYKYSHIENAVNVNYYSFSFREQIEKLDRDKTYIVHCHSGVRSGKTIPIMLRAGFKNIIHMDDGMKGWKQAELPTQ